MTCYYWESRSSVNNTDKSRKRTRDAKRILKDIIYPHNIHPALVPGVSIEDQKVKYGVDKPILIVVGSLIVAFVAWGIFAPEQVFNASSAALDWVMRNLGWIFTTRATFLMFVLLILAFSKYGKIPLGVDGEKPEFSTVSWAAMLFGAGIGIGIIFFGPFEPLSYYLSPRPGAYEAASDEAVMGAMAQAAMHWGINAWAIYAIVGLCVAYVSYRRGRVPLMSSILMPLFGNRDTDSVPARIIDGLAIIATLFGTAATLGIGALQIGRGVEIVSGWSTTGNTAAMIIIMVLSIGTIFSAVSGVSKGIRWLSNINLVLAVGLAVFFFVVGPTAFLMNMLPSVIIEYLDEMPSMLSANMGQGEDMVAFLSSWTTFYWAWWVSWAPFVGVFVAKISRGRTIRQYILGVLLIPSAIIVCAFTILGGTTIWLQRRDGDIAPRRHHQLHAASGGHLLHRPRSSAGRADHGAAGTDHAGSLLHHHGGLRLAGQLPAHPARKPEPQAGGDHILGPVHGGHRRGHSLGRRPQRAAGTAEPHYGHGLAVRCHHCAHVYLAHPGIAP